jgi:putative DNA primase/helicase
MRNKPKSSSKRSDEMRRVPETADTSEQAVHLAAEAYKRGGLSLIPIRADATKRPACELLPEIWSETKQRFTHPWGGYRKRRPTNAELRAWFRVPFLQYGMAILGGAISGNLEIIDLDNWDVVAPWMQLVEQQAPGLLDELVLVRTPRPGLHAYYRCPTISGSQKLARVPDPESDGKKPKTVIETKSEGGYCLAPPSPSGCHPTGRKYTVVSSRGLDDIPTITAEQRDILLDCARQLNQWERPKPAPRPVVRSQTQAYGGKRPGDDFNARADWSDILGPHGWTLQGQGAGEIDYWCRPGKDFGASATTNYEGSGLLYVFSSNASPFDEGRPYSKFHAYVLLEHGGDFNAAARALARRGYGSRTSGKAGKKYNPYAHYSKYKRLRKGSSS